MRILHEAKTAFTNILRPLSPRRKRMEISLTLPMVDTAIDVIGPGIFDTKEALKRLLNGDNLEDIFHLKPENQLTREDFSGDLFGGGGAYAWQKKAVINTLRRAACMTIASALEQEPLNGPFYLPEVDVEVTPEVAANLQSRALASFKLIPGIAERLGIHYDSMFISPFDSEVAPLPTDTVFEKALLALDSYIGDPLFNHKTAVEAVRRATLEHIVKQDLTGELAPDYIGLLVDTFYTDHAKFGFENEWPTFVMLKNLVVNSDANMLRGAAHTIFHMHLLYEDAGLTVDMAAREAVEHPTLSTGARFERDKFELIESKKPGGYAVMLRPEVMQHLMTLRRTRENNGVFNTMETGCPANPELIRAVIVRAVKP